MVRTQLERVGLPNAERVARSYPHELSGGMLQRAMIATALLCDPQLLVMDEPTTALDVTIAQQILTLVLDLKNEFGFGVLLITHNLEVVHDVCDRVAVLYAGRVVEVGPTDERPDRAGAPLHAWPGRRAAEPAGARRVAGRHSRHRPRQPAGPHRLRLRVPLSPRDGGVPHRGPPPRSRRPAPRGRVPEEWCVVSALLEGRSIVKEFTVKGESVTAVDGVDVRVERGMSYGLVGESGSGKTTLIRCLLRLTKPTSGQTLFDGTDLGTLNARQLRAVRRRIGVVFQNPVLALNPRMRVADSVAEPLRTHTRLRGPELERAIAKILDDVGLPAGYGDRLPHQLSGGQCQRVGIARALSTQPDLLVLDEPTSALDVSVQAQILNLLRELRETRQLTYLLISHDLDVIRYMSDHVAVMYRGRVVEEGPTGDGADRAAERLHRPAARRPAGRQSERRSSLPSQ